jgi:hypothetical protein
VLKKVGLKKALNQQHELFIWFRSGWKSTMKPHYFLTGFFIALSAYGLLQGLHFGLASFHNYSVINMLKHWQDSPLVHNYDDYARIKGKAQQVVLYHPHNAEYWDLKAQVHEWGFIFGYEKHEGALLDIKKQYLRATELRPLWPDSWASLVKLKWRLKEFDDEMLHYFERATVLGPQKPKVHLTVIELGLSLYANNHLMLLNIRPEFHRRLAFGLRHAKTRERARRLITQYDSQALVCRWLRNEDLNTRKLIPNCK